MTHLTLDLLSAHLDGVLQAASSDAVRHHLEWCEQCRAEGVRISSTNDALAALLTHDPDDRFVEAFGSFLEDEIEAKDPSGPLPPALDQAVAAESARLDERRWAAVAEAVPRALIGTARGAEGLAAPGSPAARRAPSETRVAPAPRDPGAIQVLSAAEVRAVGPARSPARARPAHGRAGRLIGAALMALGLLSAGLYVAMLGSRSWPSPLRISGWYHGVSRTGTGAAPAAVRSGSNAAAVANPTARPGAVTDSGIAASGAAGTRAKDSVAAPDHGARTTVVRATAPRTSTVASPPAAGTAPRTSNAGSSPAAGTAPRTPAADSSRESPPRVASSPPARPRAASPPAAQPAPTRSRPPAAAAPAEWGILCGQVRDERGAPVVRARVMLADLEVGALTDHRGRFCISVPVGARTVSVIALGFATLRRTVTVKHTTPELALTLRPAAEP